MATTDTGPDSESDGREHRGAALSGSKSPTPSPARSQAFPLTRMRATAKVSDFRMHPLSNLIVTHQAPLHPQDRRPQD
eukprot:2052830-Rhodomonas_salina.1